MVRTPLCWAAVFVTFLLLMAGIASAQDGKATFLVRTDADCNWVLDGEQKGVLKTADRVRVEVQLGQHLIEATSIDGKQHWEKVITAKEPMMQIVDIGFLKASQPEATANPHRESTQSNASPSPSAVAGTSWQGLWVLKNYNGKPYKKKKKETDDPVQINFSTKVRLVWTGSGHVREGTWVADGSTVTLHFAEEHYCEFTFVGTIHDSSIEGTFNVPKASNCEAQDGVLNLQRIARTEPVVIVDSQNSDPELMHDSGLYVLSASDSSKRLIKIPGSTFDDRVAGSFGASLSYGLTKAKEILSLPGTRATTHTAGSPAFYLYLPYGGVGDGFLTAVQDFVLVRLTSTPKERQFIGTTARAFMGSSTSSYEKAKVPIMVASIKPGIYRITPAEPLATGEYAFFLPSDSKNAFDFSVE